MKNEKWKWKMENEKWKTPIPGVLTDHGLRPLTTDHGLPTPPSSDYQTRDESRTEAIIDIHHRTSTRTKLSIASNAARPSNEAPSPMLVGPRSPAPKPSAHDRRQRAFHASHNDDHASDSKSGPRSQQPMDAASRVLDARHAGSPSSPRSRGFFPLPGCQTFRRI